MLNFKNCWTFTHNFTPQLLKLSLWLYKTKLWLRINYGLWNCWFWWLVFSRTKASITTLLVSLPVSFFCPNNTVYLCSSCRFLRTSSHIHPWLYVCVCVWMRLHICLLWLFLPNPELNVSLCIYCKGKKKSIRRLTRLSQSQTIGSFGLKLELDKVAQFKPLLENN